MTLEELLDLTVEIPNTCHLNGVEMSRKHTLCLTQNLSNLGQNIKHRGFFLYVNDI